MFRITLVLLLVCCNVAMAQRPKKAKPAKATPVPAAVNKPREPELTLPLKTGMQGDLSNFGVLIQSIIDDNNAILLLVDTQPDKPAGSIERETVYATFPTKDLVTGVRYYFTKKGITRNEQWNDLQFKVTGVKPWADEKLRALEIVKEKDK